MNNFIKLSNGIQPASTQKNNMPRRKFTNEDIPVLLNKIFSEFDTDKNERFSKAEFPRVIDALVQMVGGEGVNEDDVEDIFNLLDVNGDETVDRKEFESILTVFFKILKEKEI